MNFIIILTIILKCGYSELYEVIRVAIDSVNFSVYTHGIDLLA